MNLFYLHRDPVIAAQMHCDQHVVKMLVETAQMLSTAHRVLDGEKTKRPSKSGKRMVDYWVHPDAFKEDVLYKACHVNHPSSVWIRESVEHYGWAKDLMNALADEFEYRYDKQHGTAKSVLPYLQLPPKSMKMTGGWAPPPQCMPDEIKRPTSQTVLAYRDFYITEKSKFAKWNKTRKSPDWYLTKPSEDTILSM